MSTLIVDNLRTFWKVKCNHCLHMNSDMTHVHAAMQEAADVLDAIDAIHQPITEQNTTTYCTECGFVWPCRTVRLLHPEMPA